MKKKYLSASRQWVLGLVLLCISQTIWAQGSLQPGSLHTQEDLDRIKAKIQAQEEPYYSDYQAMISTGYAQTDFWFREQEYICRGGNCSSIYLEELDTNMHENYMILARACAAAQALALRWHITGDDQYADAAVAGLNKWANTMKYLRGNTNKSLAAGIYGYQMAVAGDLLRNYERWPESEQTVFKDWLIDNFYYGGGGVRDFLDRRHGTCDSHYRSNWDACNLAATMAIGVYCERQDIFDYGVDYLQNGRGSGALKNLVWYIHPDGLGQTEESNRDQPHNIVSLGWTSIALEIARNQGVDLWAYDDHRFLRAVEYVAKFNSWEDVPNLGYRTCSLNYTEHPGGNGPSSLNRGQKRPVWELIHNHFAKRLGIATPYAQQMAENNRPERGSGYYGTTSGGFDTFGYGTLLFYRDQEVPSAAPQGILTSQHGQSVVVSWLGSQGASGYEVKRAEQPGGPYELIGSTDAKTLAFTDKEVSIAGGTEYYYQITAKNTTNGDLSSEEAAFKPELVSHFEFEDNADDTQGNNVMTLHGSPAFGEGKTGQAIVFDGESDYLQLPERSYGYSDMTIATWVNWDGGAGWQRIFDFGVNTTVNMMLTPNTGGGKMRFQISTTRGNEGTERIEVDALPEGEWAHVAVTLNGEIGTLYVNGEPVGILNDMKTKPRFPLTNSYIGKSQWPDALYKGKMDDFRIYDFPLNGADVWGLAHPGEDPAPRFVANTMKLPDAIQDSLYSFVTLPDSVIVSSANESFSFTKISGPDWLQVAADGTLSGSPENSDVGENSFVIQVKDTRGASDETTLNMFVENVNDPPVWEADTLRKPDGVWEQLYSATFSDDAFDIDQGDTLTFSKINGPDWVSISPEGELSGTPLSEDIGENMLTVRVTDLDGAFSDVTVQIKILGPELIARYRFEGNAEDSKGSYHGTVSGNLQYISGIEGEAVNFTGSDDITLPENITGIMKDFTVALWVKLDSLDNWARLFDFGVSTSQYMFLTPRNGANGRVRFEIKNGSSVHQINCDDTLSIDEWTHLAVTFDHASGTGVLYVNGQEAGRNESMTINPLELGFTTQNYIGKSQWPDPNLRGAIDDFRIYSYGLTAPEIEAIYDKTDIEPAELLALYKFEGNAEDTEGNYHGTTSGNPQYVNGIEGHAINFTGSDYVTLPENITQQMVNFTVSSWVKLDALENWARVFDFGENTSRYMFLTPRNGANGRVRFAIKNGSSENQINCDETLTTGVWTHLAVTLDHVNGTGVLYVNGQEVGRNENMTISPADLGNTTRNYIGKSQWSDPNLKGAIDDFRIYNYSLTATEIEDIYNKTDLEPNELTALYRFEGNAEDSEKSYHGTVSGNPQYVSGVDGQAINFTGADDVTLPENMNSLMKNFTVSSWVKLDALDNWARVFDFGEGTSRYMFLTPRNGANGRVRFAIKNGGSENQINCDDTLSIDVWTHLAVTFDHASGTGVLYINGQEAGRNENMTIAPPDLGNTTQNYIGKSQWPDPNLRGAIDDFRIYNYGFSAGEVEALYQSFDPGSQNTARLGFIVETDAESIITSIQKEDVGSAIVVHPNPTDGALYYKADFNEENGALLSVISANGTEIIQQEISQNVGVIDLSGLTKGIYVIQLFDGRKMVRKKIIKK